MTRAKIDAGKQHGSIYPGPSPLQDEAYREMVARNVKERADKRKKEKEAAA